MKWPNTHLTLISNQGFSDIRSKVNGKRLAYLDSTATSQTPVQVLNVLEDY